MSDQILDRLLLTLDVAVEAFAVCEVARGTRLVARGGPDIEVHYILAGTMHLNVPGGAPIVCGPGTVIIVPPGVGQKMGADDGPGRDLVAVDHCRTLPSGLIHFDGADGGQGELRFVCGLVKASISGTFGLLDTIRRPIVEDLSGNEAILANFRLMAAERDAPGLGSRAMMSALMKACLLVVLRRHIARSDHETGLLGSLRDPRLGKAVTAVLDKPAARHSVAALASTAGMSRSAFAREFSQTFAMSPMEFVARTRLHQAAELLRSTNMPVKVIAASIGFSSRSHFSRAFRDGYGADPTAYRRAIAGSGDPAGGEAPVRPPVPSRSVEGGDYSVAPRS